VGGNKPAAESLPIVFRTRFGFLVCFLVLSLFVFVFIGWLVLSRVFMGACRGVNMCHDYVVGSGGEGAERNNGSGEIIPLDVLRSRL
jgi:hypothetical protein